jgi:hypothetical protein
MNNKEKQLVKRLIDAFDLVDIDWWPDYVIKTLDEVKELLKEPK